jgi:hypothetical protein
MNSYFALHKGYGNGREFKTDMGYGFKPQSTQNWFRKSDSGKRVPPVIGSLVYIIQRQKASEPYQLVGKYQISSFGNPDFSWGKEKTHRARLEDVKVPKEPILLDKIIQGNILEKGFDSEYLSLVNNLKLQNSSFKHPLEKSVSKMLDWLLQVESEGEYGTATSVPPEDVHSSPEETYKKAEVKIRQGQEKFRRNVEKVWKGKQCAVTGISYEPLLIASHIVRFSDCSTGEHWDGANGMFLTAHLDALFDKYLITFIIKLGDFRMKFSKNVDDAALHALNVNEYDLLNTVNLSLSEQRKFESYMLRHNEIFFNKEKGVTVE